MSAYAAGKMGILMENILFHPYEYKVPFSVRMKTIISQIIHLHFFQTIQKYSAKIMAKCSTDDDIEESYVTYEEYKEDGDDDDDDDDVDDDDDEDEELHEIVKCKYCKKKLTKRNMRDHIQRKHMVACPYCDSQMVEGRLDDHLKRKHMSACKHCNEMIIDREMSEHIQSHFAACEYCGNRMLRKALQAHIQQRHNFDALVGIIHGNRLTDDKFNDLVKQSRIYSLNGIIYVGE